MDSITFALMSLLGILTLGQLGKKQGDPQGSNTRKYRWDEYERQQDKIEDLCNCPGKYCNCLDYTGCDIKPRDNLRSDYNDADCECDASCFEVAECAPCCLEDGYCVCEDTETVWIEPCSDVTCVTISSPDGTSVEYYSNCGTKISKPDQDLVDSQDGYTAYHANGRVDHINGSEICDYIIQKLDWYTDTNIVLCGGLFENAKTILKNVTSCYPNGPDINFRAYPESCVLDIKGSKCIVAAAWNKDIIRSYIPELIILHSSYCDMPDINQYLLYSFGYDEFTEPETPIKNIDSMDKADQVYKEYSRPFVTMGPRECNTKAESSFTSKYHEGILHSSVGNSGPSSMDNLAEITKACIDMGQSVGVTTQEVIAAMNSLKTSFANMGDYK